MLREFLFLTIGLSAVIGMLGAPGQLQAQGSRGGFRPAFQARVNPNMQRAFTPNMQRAFTPGFRFDSRFNGRQFDPRFNGRRFDRFEDRSENRFGSRRFDRFEDRFENRFRFDPRFDNRSNGGFFNSRFSPGF
jgi:hypothetical protein